MDIRYEINQEQFYKLMMELNSFKNELPRHLRTIVSKVGKTVRVKVGQKLGQVMYLKSNDGMQKGGRPFEKAATLKRVIARKQAPTDENPTVILSFGNGKPFPLKYYNARPYIKKEKGQKQFMGIKWSHKPVNYKKRGNWNGIVEDAFIIPRYNNHVFRRHGKRRIVRVVGPAPGDYFEQINAVGIATSVAEDRLPKEIRKRIREIILEKKGIIQLKTSRGR